MRASGTEAVRLTLTECCVLGLLVGKEHSGYDLNKLAQQSVGIIYAPAKSRIYAVLPRLLKRGLVTRRAVSQRRRPDKVVYRITPTGRKALRHWLNDTSEPVGRSVLLLKVFFGSEAEPEALTKQLLRRRAEVVEELETLHRIDDSAKGPRVDEVTFFTNLTLDWGLAIDPVEIAWIDRTLRRIAARVRSEARRAVPPASEDSTTSRTRSRRP